ncbi:hypothetical protein [Nocardia sp. NPDC006630]
MTSSSSNVSGGEVVDIFHWVNLGQAIDNRALRGACSNMTGKQWIT